jgi:CO dehydrogenase maturation factor
MRKIVSMGRGGVGKSTFIAGLARFLKDSGPLLLIDADPDQCLAEMVGLDLEDEKLNTISDLLFNIREGQIEERMKNLSMQEKVDYLLNQNGLYEGQSFDLLCLGTKWSEGCYCRPNFVLKEVLEKIAKNYSYVLIDSPAGLEHLNRRVMSSVDDVFVMIGPSKKAFDNAKRARRVIEEIGITCGNFYLVANHEFPVGLLHTLKEQGDFKYAGRIEMDRNVAEFNLEGKSLLDLKDDSPFLNSVKKIVHDTGL